MQIEVIALSLSGNLVRAHLDCRLISFSRRQNFHSTKKSTNYIRQKLRWWPIWVHEISFQWISLRFIHKWNVEWQKLNVEKNEFKLHHQAERERMRIFVADLMNIPSRALFPLKWDGQKKVSCLSVFAISISPLDHKYVRKSSNIFHEQFKPTRWFLPLVCPHSFSE